MKIIQVQQIENKITVKVDVFTKNERSSRFSDPAAAWQFALSAAKTAPAATIEDYTSQSRRIEFRRGAAGFAAPASLDEDGVGQNWQWMPFADAPESLRSRFADLDL